MAQRSTPGKTLLMVPIDRPSGQNDVGIVAWLLTLKTPECPQGRQASHGFSLQLENERLSC